MPVVEVVPDAPAEKPCSSAPRMSCSWAFVASEQSFHDHMTGAKSGLEASTPLSRTATTTSSRLVAASGLFQSP